MGHGHRSEKTVLCKRHPIFRPNHDGYGIGEEGSAKSHLNSVDTREYISGAEQYASSSLVTQCSDKFLDS